MKALRLRKTLWLVNTVFVAGIAGLGALYVLQKPAEAKDVVATGRKTVEDYRLKQPKPVLVPPVKEEDVKAYILKEEWKALKYYPYAGPKVPAPKPPEAVKPVEQGPKDLEATGRPFMLVYDPPRAGETVASGSTVYWEFNGDKKPRISFSPGEWVRTDAKAPERFKLVDVIREQPTPDVSRYRILYDVYEKGPDPATARRAELRWDTTGPANENVDRIFPPTVKPAAPGTPAAVVGPEGPGKPPVVAPGPGVVPTPGVVPAEPAPVAADTGWKPEITVQKSGERLVEWTDATVKRFKGKKPDEVLNEVLKGVRTENYDKGGVSGIQVFPADNDEMAQAFDVRRGDVLVSINGQPVKSKDDAIRIARVLPQDTARVSVVIDRNGRQISYTVDPRDPQTRRAAAGLVPK